MTDPNTQPGAPATSGGNSASASHIVPVRSEQPLTPVRPVPFVVALIGHALMGVLLVAGVKCTPKPPEEVIIQAVLLEEPVVGEKPLPVEEAVKPKPPEPLPPPPTPEPPKPEPPKPTPPPPTPTPPKPEPPKPDPEKVKQAAEAAEKKRVEDLAKQEQEILLSKQKAEQQRLAAEEKAKADAEKAKTEADAKAKREADEAARKVAEEQARKAALDAEQKRLADIEEAKRKAAEAAENQRKAEETARREALAKQLAAEEAARMAAIRADSQKLWARALADALRRNWLRQPGAENFACKVKIRMLPNGQVVSATIVNSCGSQLLDDSVIAAANKASPLPLPSEASAFVPEVTITFKP